MTSLRNRVTAEHTVILFQSWPFTGHRPRMTRLQATQLGQRASVCLCVRTLVSLTTQRPAAHTPSKWTITPLRSETQHGSAIDVSCVFAFRQEANQSLFVSFCACVSVLWWMLNKMRVQNVKRCLWSREGFCVWGEHAKGPTFHPEVQLGSFCPSDI